MLTALPVIDMDCHDGIGYKHSYINIVLNYKLNSTHTSITTDLRVIYYIPLIKPDIKAMVVCKSVNQEMSSF